MEVAELIAKIVFGGCGLLTVFLLGSWFRENNKIQKEIKESLQDGTIMLVETRKDNERQDLELVALRKLNEQADIEFKSEATLLAQEMGKMAQSISSLCQKTSIHELEIENLKESQRIISEEMRSKKGR